MQVKKFQVDNLKNADDMRHIRGEIQSLPGIHAVRMDNFSNTITVEYDSKSEERNILEIISKYETL